MNVSTRTPLLAIVGPTAGGKTALALALAKELGGEIVSCDSMQLYRGMDIGTAKPTAAELASVPHHLIDILDPRESFSLAEYVTLAQAKIEEITARGQLPLFCGGTGLYLEGVLYGGSFGETAPCDPAFREALNRRAADGEGEALWQELWAVDPVSAAAIHPNNVKRVIRALEIYRAAGVPKSALDRLSRERGMLYDATVLGIRYHSRELLGKRIDSRVTRMLDAGLLDECRRLYEAGLLPDGSTAAQAIGYKELLPVLRGETSLSDAAEALRLATRHYAKRQMTWFSAKPYVTWLYADTEEGSPRPVGELLADALSFCRK